MKSGPKNFPDNKTPKPARGRPRSFDPDKVLDKAIQVFWKKGYEGASLPDLTKAMGINRPSMYAAFGNKEALFRRALDRYVNGPLGHWRQALDQPTARRVAESLLAGMVDMLGDSNNPGGCLVVHAGLTCSAESTGVRDEMVCRRNAGEAMLRERFARAVKEGDLPASASPAYLAAFVCSVGYGLSILAVGGASRKKMAGVVETAMRAWPSGTKRQ